MYSLNRYWANSSLLMLLPALSLSLLPGCNTPGDDSSNEPLVVPAPEGQTETPVGGRGQMLRDEAEGRGGRGGR